MHEIEAVETKWQPMDAVLSARAKQIKKIANASQFNAAQIRTAVAQSSQNFSGFPTNALGYGVLDVEAFLKSFGL